MSKGIALKKILCLILIMSMVLGAGFTAVEADGGSAEQSAVVTENEEEEIFELTNEPEGNEFDGYTVKLNDEMDRSMEKDIKASDNAESVTDVYVSVDDPVDALEFAEPEDIEYIEPNYYMYLDASETEDEDVTDIGDVEKTTPPAWELEFPKGKPNDPGYGSWKEVDKKPGDPGYNPSNVTTTKAFELRQWNLDLVNAPYAWEKGYRGDGVNVGVIDTGLWSGMKDLDVTRVLPGRSFADGSNTSYTEGYNGHGSRVTGIFFSMVNNGRAYAGITDRVNVMPIKVRIDKENRVTGENFIKGFAYARAQGLDIINISMGMYYDYQPLEDEIALFAHQGGITVAPVGNHNRTTYRYPASYDHVVGVGGVTSSGDRWNDSPTKGSNTNSKVYVVAPAKSVPIINNDTDQMSSGSGCSYAVPHVTALATVAKQYSKQHGGRINITEFKALLRATSTDKGVIGKDNSYGYGLINFKAFIDAMTPENTSGRAEITPYYIKYVRNGGKFTGRYTNTYNGSRNAYLSQNITRKGYTFAGWYKASNFSTKRVRYIPKGWKGNRTFHAKWNIGKYTLKFNVNKGRRIKTKSKTLTHNRKIGWLPKPKRKGYNFLGWYTKAGSCYSATRVFKLGRGNTVYARWTKRRVIKFVPQNGIVLKFAQAFTRGRKIGTLPTPTRKGYAFKGWYLKRKGGQKITGKNRLMKKKNYTLYAQWRKA